MEALSQLTTAHKVVLVCTLLHFGYGSSTDFGIPIWFESPKTQCYDALSQTYLPCQEDEACA